MSCPSVEQLAAAAAGEHARAADHALACAECASLLAQQTEVRALGRQLVPPRLSPLRRARLALAYDPVEEIRSLASQLPPPTLEPRRRAELAAETLALAETVQRQRVPWFILGPVLAAAAAVALVVALRRDPTLVAVAWPDHAWLDAHGAYRGARAPATPPEALVHASSPLGPVAPIGPSGHGDPSPRASSSRVAASVSGNADYSRDRDRVELRDGTIAIDARDRSPVAVAIGDTTIHVKDARVVITAAHGVIVSAHAFAGSVERTSPESTTIISAGEVWTPPAAEVALRAFRTGWTALHEGRNADALAAFSRASDPVISEEAAFWAAVAEQRLGDHEAAVARFKAFLDAYPASTRAAAARSALDKL